MKTNLGESLIESVSENAAIDTAADVAELALDAALNEGLLKDIPIFGWIMRRYRAVIDVRDRILLKKNALFLNSLNKIDENQRLAFVNRILRNDVEKRKFGEQIILLLDRQESFDKSTFLGTIFAAYLRSEIERWEFDAIAAGIDTASIIDLNDLLSGYRKYIGNEREFNLMLHGTLQRLVPAGFASIRFDHKPWENVNEKSGTNNTVWFSITEAGKRFFEFLSPQ
ncbi:hypothetical protein KA005_64565 [bacterium]|nr:hypothetical protein [bacterium]